MNKDCAKCGGEGWMEIYGDGDGFEYDVIDMKRCPDCVIEYVLESSYDLNSSLVY